MPQSPMAVTFAQNASLNQKQAVVDGVGNLVTTRGGTASVMNVTAAAVVKAAPGRIAKIVIVDPGTTSGAFTINDCATTGAAAAANTIWSAPYNGTGIVKGAIIDLDWPCAVGIVVSAVAGGGTPILAISYR